MPEIKDAAKRERNAQKFFGCSEADAMALNAGRPLRQREVDSVASRYLSQRARANRRGIAWDITLPEWVAIWIASGKWDMRGRGKGKYCMAREGDIGPYKVGNVSIQLVEQNSRDGIKVAQKNLRAAGTDASHKQCGKGRGWTYIKRSKSNPYQVVVAKKYIGSFPTQKSAEEAYRVAAGRHVHLRRVELMAPTVFRSPVHVITNGNENQSFFRKVS